MCIRDRGRTARANNEGVSVMVCSPQESMGPLRKLRKILANKAEANPSKNKKWQKTVPLLPIETDIVSQLRERTRLASELADHEMASSSLRKDDNWMKQAADDLGIDIDSDDEDKDSILHRSKTKKINKTMGKDDVKYTRAKLNELLRQNLRTDMRKKYLTGGLSIQKQERLLKYDNSGKIVIATPGRFLELLEKNNELVERFAQIDTLVLDEADRLLQDGHFDEFEKILKYLGQKRKEMKLKNTYWQTMIYSATFSIDLFDKLANSSWKSNKKVKQYDSEMETVLHHLMNKIHFKSKPILIDMNPNQKISSQIKESLIECAPTERDLYCYYFITMFPGTTLIFCNAIESVKKLSVMLNILGVSCLQIHSSMTQKNRLRNLEKYEEQSVKNNALGKATVLIASDVAARGLDIPNIKHVIHCLLYTSRCV